MIFRITFQQPEDVTNRGMDGVEFAFPFSLVDADLVDLPEELPSTKQHRILIAMHGSRLATWNLSGSDLTKVLFEFAKRHLAELLRSRMVPADYTIKAPMITTDSHPGGCHFAPSAICEPARFTMTVEQQKAQIGFHRDAESARKVSRE